MFRKSAMLVAVILSNIVWGTIVSAAVPVDNTKPTTPTALTVTGVTSTTVGLSYGASTDPKGTNGVTPSGVKQYNVEACPGTTCTNFALVTTSLTTVAVVSNLTPNRPYRFRVRAQDNVGNLSAYSNVVGALTALAQGVTTCTDPAATNYGQAGNCTYPPPPLPQTCTDPSAINNGQLGVCTYPPIPVAPAPGACDGGIINLRFDDGPRPETSHILDVLKQYNLKATFFVIGYNVQAYPDIARRIVAEGHQIANHTMNHYDMTTLTADQMDMEIQQDQDIIKAVTGQTPLLFAAPYTSVTPLVEARVAAAGLTLTYYTVDTFDWTYTSANVNDGVNTAYLAALTLQPGDILELHDWALPTPWALPYIADFLSGASGVYTADGGVFVNRPSMCTGKLTYTPETRNIPDWLAMYYHVKAVSLETPIVKQPF